MAGDAGGVVLLLRTKFKSIVIAFLAASISAGANAEELFSRADCPKLTVTKAPSFDEWHLPSHIDKVAPSPFAVTGRCEVVEKGELQNCSVRTEQEHKLSNLKFVERTLLKTTVSDLPRPCGQTQISFSFPLAKQKSEKPNETGAPERPIP